jgi:NADH:ubiquinone oxidoreductase subunit 6 (subunit J)
MVSILYLVEELAARAYYSLYSLAGKKRRVATVFAYFAYYATMSALLMLYAFAIMMVFSATLFLLDPSLYELATQSQWIPPIHLFFLGG